MSEDLKDVISENAKGPKRVKGDAGEMEQHSLTDQIAAAKHVASCNAGRNPAAALMRVKIVSPGSV